LELSTINKTPISQVAFFATFAEILNVDVPEDAAQESVSFARELLDSPGGTRRNFALVSEDNDASSCVRVNGIKMIPHKKLSILHHVNCGETKTSGGV